MENVKMEGSKTGVAKRNMTLELFAEPRHLNNGSSLVTPTLNLTTPEYSKMINCDELTVLTPNGISSLFPSNNVLPSPLIPTTVNNSNIINNTPSSNNNNTSNIGSSGISNHGTQLSVTPNGNQNQNHQTSHNKRQRINAMDSPYNKSSRGDPDNEKIEKKRERNRLAAKKCRQRKLETIEELRKQVAEWQQKYKLMEIEYQREIDILKTKLIKTQQHGH